MIKNNEQWAAELHNRSQLAGQLFAEFVKVVAELRHPERGCPWDLQQDHQSLRKFMLEEAYEASEAMEENDADKILEELGDVLLQVVLNAQLLTDHKRGDISQVIEGIRAKMIRRHPHVFERDNSDTLTPAEVKAQWQVIKQAEKASMQSEAKAKSIFAEAEKSRFPANLQASLIGKIAKRIGFDWDKPEQVLAQLDSEIAELKQEMQSPTKDRQRLIDELGDVYFTLAQLSRHLKLDPEVAAQSGNLKFLHRFRRVEALAKEEGIDLQAVSMNDWERLWQKAKDEQSGDRDS